MNEEQNSSVREGEVDELSTTPPNPPNEPAPRAAGGGWVMPAPVFRQSSGFEPKMTVRTPAQEDPFFEDTTAVPNKVLEEAAELAAAAKAGPASVSVEPQPDISEAFENEDISSEPAAPVKKSGAGRIVSILIFIIAAIAVIAIFLFIVTYLFLSKSGDSSF